MEKDKAYKTLKKLLESGSIDDLEEIINIIGKTNFTTTIGMHYYTFQKRLKNPEEFSIGHLLKIADLIGVDVRLIANLIFDKLDRRKKKSKA